MEENNTDNTSPVEVTEQKDAQAPSQDPIKQELDKVKGQERSKLEQAEYNLKKNVERLKQLGGDPTSILGSAEETEDDKPLTIGEFKRLKQQEAQATALQMADGIQDESERELTKHYIATRIVPSGNPEEDLKFARAAVNSVKNSQIAEEMARKGTAKTHSSGTSAPEKGTEAFTPTEAEASMMRSFGLSEKDILKAREEEAKQAQ